MPGWLKTDKCDKRTETLIYSILSKTTRFVSINTKLFLTYIEQTFNIVFKELACRNGTFRKGCMQKCSRNCLNNDSCDKSDGECGNCAPGWVGHLCNKGKNK